MIFIDKCEDFNADQDRKMDGDGKDFPSLDMLTPGTKLYVFVNNPNVKIAENGDYIINFDDPNFIPSDDYRGYQEKSDPNSLPIVIRVNFQNHTAFVQVGDMAIDQSRKYFPIQGDTTP